MSIKGLVKKAASTYARSKSRGPAHGAHRPTNRPVRKQSAERKIVNGVVKYAKKRL
ncbi:hypothetical protein ROJ8625_03538 [Roseivivax jejudonensis]|uniref:Uncharacterized protein n=1 Tax=Roseivivax jejudonensis TaxID=1529041 RepID=A0A1X7A2C0_9RHOB|nr:hypothetical protein [Roseivivax jejudonensis]SLN68309.1 hypothetical protein ROJ8625_03538 [Roseivivax jejudonensis]